MEKAQDSVKRIFSKPDDPGGGAGTQTAPPPAPPKPAKKRKRRRRRKLEGNFFEQLEQKTEWYREDHPTILMIAGLIGLLLGWSGLLIILLSFFGWI